MLSRCLPWYSTALFSEIVFLPYPFFSRINRGELSRVADVIAKENGNVIKLEHNQFVSINRSAAVELRITLEAFGTEHKQQIISALEREGYKPKSVRTNI